MTELRPGTTMYRIAELELATERTGRLENELARQVQRLWTHIGNMPGGV